MYNGDTQNKWNTGPIEKFIDEGVGVPYRKTGKE